GRCWTATHDEQERAAGSDDRGPTAGIGCQTGEPKGLGRQDGGGGPERGQRAYRPAPRGDRGQAEGGEAEPLKPRRQSVRAPRRLRKRLSRASGPAPGGTDLGSSSDGGCVNPPYALLDWGPADPERHARHHVQ